MGFFKFLKSLRTLAKNGNITIDEAYKFARQEFGEVSDLLKLQINKIFKDVDAPSIKLPKKGGEVVPFEKKQASGIMATDEASSLMKGLEEGVEALRGSENLSTALTRTLAREILMKRGIELVKGMDPIESFRTTFGQDVLGDVANLADELIEMDRMGRKPKRLDDILEQEGFFDIEIPKDPPQGMTDKELLNKMEEVEQEDILKNFDPEDREPNAMGGINRTNFAIGAFSKATVLIQRLKNTLKAYKNDKTEMGQYIRETFPGFIKEIEAKPQLADNPKVAEAFGITDLGEASGKQRLVEYEDGSVDFFTKGSKKGMDSTKQLADELGIPMEEAIKIKQMEPEDQVLEINRRRRLLDKSRTQNAEGGLNYLMGL